MAIKVVNKHHGQSGIYIGRGSPLGNQWPINNAIGDTRDVVIDRYSKWIREQISEGNTVVIAELKRIGHMAMDGDVSIQCFCAPLACHGDVIKFILDTTIKKYREES